MSKFLSQRFWSLRARREREPDPRERVLAQRDRLLLSALQLLHDPLGAQEVVLRALEQALRSPLLVRLAGDGEQALYRWLDRLVVGHSLSRLRAGRQTEPVRAPSSPSASAPGGSSGEILQLERLAQQLRALSPEARVTVTLVVMQRRALAEAAELLDVSEESCHFWLNHGRKQLRRALQRDLCEDEGGPPGPRPPAPIGTSYDLRRGKKTAARA